MRAAACLAALAAGCAGSPPAADQGFRGTPTYLGTADPVAAGPAAAEGARAAPTPAGQGSGADDEVALERELRAELATAQNPTAAALELSGLLAELERHPEALAVVTAARQRSTDPVLRVAAAGLHRDLGQRHLAVAELAALRSEQGALALHPSLLFELAELQWLEGAGDEALATTAELRRVHADSAWFGNQGESVKALELEIGTRQAPSRVRVRDLLGNLRGAPSLLVRLRTLEELVQLADASGTGPTARLSGLRDRAIAIACGDAEPTVRARAIQLAAPGPQQVVAFCRAALGDTDAKVRAVAAERTAALQATAAPTLLVGALAGESDPAAFRAMHEALGTVVAGGPALAPGAEQDPAQRQTAVAAWKERCNL